MSAWPAGLVTTPNSVAARLAVPGESGFGPHSSSVPSVKYSWETASRSPPDVSPEGVGVQQSFLRPVCLFTSLSGLAHVTQFSKAVGVPNQQKSTQKRCVARPDQQLTILANRPLEIFVLRLALDSHGLPIRSSSEDLNSVSSFLCFDHVAFDCIGCDCCARSELFQNGFDASRSHKLGRFCCFGDVGGSRKECDDFGEDVAGFLNVALQGDVWDWLEDGQSRFE